MKILKLICLTMIEWVKQALLLPGTIAEAARNRRRKSDFNKYEMERLDRIRNPSKYLGK
jgi:hypothetical protein